jgi:hypothetical protein
MLMWGRRSLLGGEGLAESSRSKEGCNGYLATMNLTRVMLMAG